MRSLPGGELPVLCAMPARELCAGGSVVAAMAREGASCGAVLVERMAATASGAWVAAQIAGPLEWQQEEARTQWCGTAMCAG